MRGIKSPRVALGVAALAGLTALGSVGVVMNYHDATTNGAQGAHFDITGVATSSTKASSSKSSSSSSSSSEPSSDESSSPAPPPASNGSVADLIDMLPPGFTSKNCKASTKPVAGSTASVDCTQNPNGPSKGTFALFANQAALDSAFDASIGQAELENCPNGKPSPGQWSYDDSKDQLGGQIACGTYQGTPALMWTENDNLMSGNIAGSSLDTLYNYWVGQPAGDNFAPAIGSIIRGRQGH
jgi:hypothetical protein